MSHFKAWIQMKYIFHFCCNKNKQKCFTLNLWSTKSDCEILCDPCELCWIEIWLSMPLTLGCNFLARIVYRFILTRKKGELLRPRIHIYTSAIRIYWQLRVRVMFMHFDELRMLLLLLMMFFSMLMFEVKVVSTAKWLQFNVFHVNCIDANKSNSLQMYTIAPIAGDVKIEKKQMFAIKVKTNDQYVLFVLISFNELVFIFSFYTFLPIRLICFRH